MDTAEAVGRRLREAREAAGLSQRKLAFPGCTPAYISRIEAGQRIPSLQLARQLAQRLDVTEAWLTTGNQHTAESLLADAELALRLDRVAEAEQLLRAARDEIPTTGDDTAEARILEAQGRLALRRGDAKQAVALLESALDRVGARVEQRPALAESLARAYAALGELAPAIGILERCVVQFAADPIQHVRFAGLLGAALTDSGDFTAAEQVIGRAIGRGRELVDPHARARLYWSESRLLAEQGRSAEAEEYAHKTLETLRTTEDTYAVSLILQTLAHIKLDLDQPHESLELLGEAWPTIAASGTPLQIAQFRLEEARALAAIGEHDRAGSLAMSLRAEFGDAHPVDSGRAFVVLGEVFEAIGERERAQEVYELAIERLEEQAPGRYLVKAYKRLGTLLRERGQRDEALELFERALGVQDAVGRHLA